MLRVRSSVGREPKSGAASPSRRLPFAGSLHPERLERQDDHGHHGHLGHHGAEPLGRLENAMKLYVDLGNVLSGLPGPASAFYNFAETTIEPSFLGPNLTDVEADVQAGLYADATLDLGLPLGQKTEIGVEGSASASADAIYGYEQTFGSASESASVKGVAATVTADLQHSGASPRLGALSRTNWLIPFSVSACRRSRR